MNMLPHGFLVEDLQCVHIPNMEETDQVPGGLSAPPVPAMAQFPKASSPAAADNN
jgi:hypothetical protein